MASSSSSSDYDDMKDAISESSSHDSTSVEYFSCEDTFPNEDPTSRGDMTSNRGSLLHLLPPNKGTEERKSKSTPIIRQYQVRDEPKQDPKISIALAWDEEDTESVARTVERLMKMLHTCLEKLNNGEESTQGDDRNPKHEEDINKKDNDKVSALSEAVEEENFQFCNHCPLHIAQVSGQECDNCQELPTHRPPGSEDVTQVSRVPLIFKEQVSMIFKEQVSTLR
ncbi:uncharacterized protein C12orf71 homolog [Octodon degus]|uniref:Uncharacterized protein C12orf71 homolog n=1 Tax=Octodon degus TaxID=10160 RepID=A0A6P3FJU4_OCTDE|nr:uncharacterized protein C12orf71 homolog [Octodon degus]